MNLPDRQTMALAAMLFASTLPVSGQPAKVIASPTVRPVAGDINSARIADQPEDPVATQSLEIASMSEIPVPVEIPAIDNLLNASSGFALPASLTNHLEVIASQAVASNGVKEILASAGAASLPLHLPTVSQSATQSSEYIDTLYPDPLSPAFPTSAAGLDKSERTKTAEEMIEEFNIQAAAIAAETAEQLDLPLASMSGIAGIISSAAVVPPAADDSRQASMTVKTDVSPPPNRVTPLPAADAKNSESSDFHQPPQPGIASGVSSPADPEDSQPSILNLQAGPTASAATWSTEISQPAPEKENLGSQTAAEPNVPENEISETPALAQTGEQTATAGLSVDMQNTPATTEEIIPVTWPESDQDPEFAPAALRPADTAASEPAGLFEKTAALEPALMTRGKPDDAEDDPTKTLKISGTLVPEKHPVGRRRQLDRWVLKTDDGQRIPLKSNLKLLTEVRRENLLDGRVTLNGRYIRSGLNESLRYFAVESAVSAGKDDASGSADIGKTASASVKLKK